MTVSPTPIRALGLMSGTSYDAIDVALIETDGERHVRSIAAGEVAYTEEERDLIANAVQLALAWRGEGARPTGFDVAEAAITAAHARAVTQFLAAEGLTFTDVDLMGFHGQTVFHKPPANTPGLTAQLGDAAALSQLCQTDVVYNFRSADVAAGGHGAPLAPIYHWALAQRDGLNDIAILNLGGVANITFVTAAPDDLIAFDTGPANGLIDQWVAEHNAGACDEGGRLAAQGQVDAGALARLMDHRHFDLPPPKSLDRYAFALEPLRGLSLEDGCATLTAFTAQTIAHALRFASRPPRQILTAGGGVNNPVLMAAIADAAASPVASAASLGWNPDALEAELMAYLAVRSRRGLPLSFPQTTGVPVPQTGGQLAKATCAARP